MSQFIIQALSSAAQNIFSVDNQNHLVANHDMDIQQGQTYRYTSGYALNSIPPGKILQVEPSPDIISNSILGQVKNYQQSDVGSPLSILLQSVARGKKKINKGNRVMKFSLKKAWQSAADTIKILPFLAKTPIKKQDVCYQGAKIKGITKYHLNNCIAF